MKLILKSGIVFALYHQHREPMRYLYFVLFLVTFISCKKKESSSFPSALFNSRTWKEMTCKPNGIKVDTTIGPNITSAVSSMDASHISFNGTTFYGQPGTDPIYFIGEHLSPTITDNLYYFIAKDSISYVSEWAGGETDYIFTY
jgi:hypothetical protein